MSLLSLNENAWKIVKITRTQHNIITKNESLLFVCSFCSKKFSFFFTVRLFKNSPKAATGSFFYHSQFCQLARIWIERWLFARCHVEKKKKMNSYKNRKIMWNYKCSSGVRFCQRCQLFIPLLNTRLVYIYLIVIFLFVL